MIANSNAKQMGIVYGPVASRRFGRSLGLNLTGGEAKACSFDCAYCDLGPTELRLNKLKKDFAFPSANEVAAALEQALKSALPGDGLDWICFSGNGEPTLHPDFDEVVRAATAVRDQVWASVKMAALTNGANADSRRVRAGLERLDARVVKLDAGNERIFKAINGPLARTTLTKAIANARMVKDVTIQSLFVKGAVDNSQPADIEDWIEAVALVRPRAVQILGLNRPGAQPGLLALEEDELYIIASKLERRTQIKAQVFY